MTTVQTRGLSTPPGGAKVNLGGIGRTHPPRVQFLPFDISGVPTANKTGALVEGAGGSFEVAEHYDRNLIQKQTAGSFDLLWISPLDSQIHPFADEVEDVRTNQRGIKTFFVEAKGSTALEVDPYPNSLILWSDVGRSISDRVNVDPVAEHRQLLTTTIRSREASLAELRRRLDAAKGMRSQSSPREVVTALTDAMGVGQLVVARGVRVSPTAVRKWRRGEPARPEHRGRLAQFAALCDLLAGTALHDPAGWLEVPISSESTLTPFDLYLHNRADLVVGLAEGILEPQEALDMFHPNWREAFPLDSEYEVITMDDGTRSAVPRPGAGVVS